MGRLIVVRHGQASFLSENYDQLSPLGRHQSYRLGEHWARGDARFDRVFSGPLERQKDTAAEVARAYAQEGLEFPKAELLDAFAEYDGDAVMHLGLPLLLARDERLRMLLAAYEAAREPGQRHAAFQRVFERVMTAWSRGEIVADQLESWQAFTVRVNAGLDQVLRESKSAATVLVFTSGGPVALAMQRALKLSTDATLQTSWMSRNASWSEFLFSGNRFTLSTFNAFGHLDDPTMHTYR